MRTEEKLNWKDKAFSPICREYITHWEKINFPYIKESTRANYLSIIENHILPYFGEKKLTEITYEANRTFILFLCREGRKDGTGGLSVKMAKDIMAVWKKILKAAEADGLIQVSNQRYLYPAKQKPEREAVKVFDIKQEMALTDFLKKNPTPKNMGILLALSTGMRIGEICALRWEHIDLEYRVIHVTETLQRIYWKQGTPHSPETSAHPAASEIIITKPKSQKSIRAIPIAKYLVPFLKPLQKQKDTFFLTGQRDKYMEPRTYRDYYSRILAKNNLPFVNFHGLRHTFATRCIEAGCDYKTVSELLGHANVETTLHLYVHSDLERKRDCIEAMQSLCQKTKK